MRTLILKAETLRNRIFNGGRVPNSYSAHQQNTKRTQLLSTTFLNLSLSFLILERQLRNTIDIGLKNVND